jgi:hypothetical protein
MVGTVNIQCPEMVDIENTQCRVVCQAPVVVSDDSNPHHHVACGDVPLLVLLLAVPLAPPPAPPLLYNLVRRWPHLGDAPQAPQEPQEDRRVRRWRQRKKRKKRTWVVRRACVRRRKPGSMNVTTVDADAVVVAAAVVTAAVTAAVGVASLASPGGTAAAAAAAAVLSAPRPPWHLSVVSVSHSVGSSSTSFDPPSPASVLPITPSTNYRALARSSGIPSSPKTPH